MKLTVDCALDGQLIGLQSNAALTYLLSKAKITQVNTPLEALICNQFGLPPCSESEIAPDYPIAAIAAAADGLDVSDAFWLRADPVNLVLQRDCFSLGEPVPLPLVIADVEKIVESLNQHFSQDGLTFYIGESGACYLRSAQDLQMKTTLPSVAAGKNIHPFMPQGLAGGKWLSVLNEIQMLLHEHPVSIAREAKGEVAVNSLWLSGGGKMPQSKPVKNMVDLVAASSPFYQGLAKWSGIRYQNVPADLNSLLNGENQQVRIQLTAIQSNFELLLTALKRKIIKQLTLNLGFYEKTLVAEITPMDIYKFWRNKKPMLTLI